MQALLAEKHVFVAGPLAATVAEVAELAAAAAAGDRRLRAYLPAVYTGGAEATQLSSSSRHAG